MFRSVTVALPSLKRCIVSSYLSAAISLFTKQYHIAKAEKLNIKWPEIVVPATSLIDDYINFIKGLIDKDNWEGYGFKLENVEEIKINDALNNTIDIIKKKIKEI